ncbi:hypothetical protein BDZ94DRAFT_1272514 [Collybia nuda]|uniref:F-box domain-containing protein n=1 Tax=Collybia nuda TaxID=64659 RepID=A0A9P5XY25_9AGAR|nr:hypothetical protein BDZ94DRAFT_1272514 [Collybia nuda]
MEARKHAENIFQQIESSPHPPSDSEREYLHDQLDIAKVELRRLDADLRFLFAKRSRVIKRINRCHTSLAPYCKLPAELIELIIECSMATHPNPSPLKGTNDIRLQLTQICRSWRTVAFGFSGLWRIFLEKLPTRSVLNLIVAWLHQSYSTRFFLGGSTGLDWSAYKDHHYILNEVIIPYAHRITSLFMMPLYTHCSDDPLRLDRLVSLSLHPTPWIIPAQRIEASSLRQFAVRKIQYYTGRRLVWDLPILPWRQLTVLAFTGMMSFPDVYDVLLECPSMESCYANAIAHDSTSGNRNTPINLLSLKVLSLTFIPPGMLQKLFLINAPNLTTLSVNHPPSTLEFIEKFANYVKRLQITLRSFEVVGSYGPYANLAPICDIIHATPFINKFIANRQHIPPTTLTKIATGELLPNVEVLHLSALLQGGWEQIVKSFAQYEP